MKVLSVDQIKRRESPLLYRITYDAVAKIMTDEDKSVEMPFEFVIESDPFGKKSVTVKLTPDHLDDQSQVNGESISESLVGQVEQLRKEGALP